MYRGTKGKGLGIKPVDAKKARKGTKGSKKK